MKNVLLFLISFAVLSFSFNMQPLGPQQFRIDNVATAKLHVQGSPDFIIADGNDIWVTNINRMDKLSLSSDSVIQTVSMPEPCGAGIAAFGSLWVASCQDKSIYRIDEASGTVISIIHTGLADPFGELSLASGAGSVWVLSSHAGILSRIDPNTNSVVNQITVKAGSYCAVFEFGSVWISNSENEDGRGSVERVDPVRNRVMATIPVGPKPHFLAAGEGGVWTLNQEDGTVTQIDPNTNEAVRSIHVNASGSGGDIATGAGKVWVRATKVLLSAIDPATGEVVATYGPKAGSGAVRVTADNVVWLSAHDVHTVWALHP